MFCPLIFISSNHSPQKFSLQISLKADVEFERQSNSFLPALKLHSRTIMSELFRRGEDFDVVLKHLDEIFLNGVADRCAENHFLWNSVPVLLKSSE
jgi:hypothetical protein